jgi:hypothetical protein
VRRKQKGKARLGPCALFIDARGGGRQPAQRQEPRAKMAAMRGLSIFQNFQNFWQTGGARVAYPFSKISKTSLKL